MSKYEPLREFLSLHRENQITLTLGQIEIIIGKKLPPAARTHYAWWSDLLSHPHTRNWSGIGWKVERHSEEGKIEWVKFKKVDK